MTKKSYVFRKALVIAIIFCFIGMSIAPSLGDVSVKKPGSTVNGTSFVGFSSRGNILYVGGSEPGNYTTIQGAIDDANPGDTVFVYDDSSPYYENIVIDKTINLIGENRNTTIIDAMGTGRVIQIESEFITVQGFTIRNAVGAGIHIGYYGNNYISDCIIYNCVYRGVGIYYGGASSNTITSDCVYTLHASPSERELQFTSKIKNTKDILRFLL